MGWVGLGWVGSGWVRSHWVRSGQVGSGRVRSGWVSGETGLTKVESFAVTAVAALSYDMVVRSVRINVRVSGDHDTLGRNKMVNSHYLYL